MSLSALVGQPLVKELFRRAVGKGTVGHAYLFTGPKGLGKTSCARNLGKALNCQSPTAEGDACDACASCQAIDAGRDDAYRLIEADGGKIKITETRDLVAGMALRPDDGRRKVYVVREADRLTPSAAQNLLKVLEEPPEYGLIILTTDNPSSLPPTILSRCQQVPFRPAPVDEVTRVLAATTGRPESEVAQAAVMSGGNLGKALDLLTSDRLTRRREANRQTAGVLGRATVGERIELLEKMVQYGEDREALAEFLGDLATLFRDGLVIAVDPQAGRLAGWEDRQTVRRLCADYDQARLHRGLGLIERALEGLRRNVQPRLAIEYVLLNL